MSLSVQSQTMFAMLATGMMVGIQIDVYHRLLVRLLQSFWLRALFDLLFWIVQSVVVFYVLWRVNEGELRFYIFLALLFGFFLYYRWGRVSFLRIMESIISICQAIRRFVVSMIRLFIIQPFRFVLKLFTSFVMIMVTIIIRVFTFIGNGLLFLLKGLYVLLKPLIRLVVPPSVEKHVRILAFKMKEWAFKNRRDGR